MMNLHEATQAMATIAGLPRLVLVAERGTGDNAEATGCCGHDFPVIRLGEDLLTGREEIQLAVLAHEMAHHELEHTSRQLPGLLEKLSWAAGGVCLVRVMDAFQYGASLPVLAKILALAVSSLIILLVARAMDRQAEYAADRRGVELLDAVGLPGLDYMRAMVKDQVMEEDTTSRFWDLPTSVRLLWVLAGHPVNLRRLAALK